VTRMLRISEFTSTEIRFRRGLSCVSLSLIVVGALLAGTSMSALASTTRHHPSALARSAKASHGGNSHRSRRVHRRGGKVQRAWPHGGRPPTTALARWLARQVGPGHALPCSKRPVRTRHACQHRGHRSVTADATLIGGSGYGIWLRANGEASTAYSVQVDTGYEGGRIILRERQSEQELSAALASAPPPTGFVWDGQPHLLSVTIQGNTLTATIDGDQVLNVANLTAASATVKYSYGLTIPIVPPLTDNYGLRAWNEAVVRVQRVTAGPVV
jgi:hypothetical protein